MADDYNCGYEDGIKDGMIKALVWLLNNDKRIEFIGWRYQDIVRHRLGELKQ